MTSLRRTWRNSAAFRTPPNSPCPSMCGGSIRKILGARVWPLAPRMSPTDPPPPSSVNANPGCDSRRAGTPNLVYPGVDYLLAYWLGRQAGFIAADAKLTITRSDTGVGKVTSNPAGINCDSDCNEILALGQSITLTATPAPGSAFAGWSGACSGQARTCTLAIAAARNVTANFVPLTIKINDITLTDGNSGLKTFNFAVSLSGLSGGSVKVNYTTANGTAQAGGDYLASYGTLTFTPGEAQKTIGIRVKGDTLKEGHETFLINLAAPTGTRLLDSQGQGTITNDD
ncbi:MAG: hypothetical protein KA125_07425 [Chromatiaceae bacterium]|nr:hypothetical protein [Chromatiaceae bacterium]